MEPKRITRFKFAPGGPIKIRCANQSGEEYVEAGDTLYLDAPRTEHEMTPSDPTAPMSKCNWVLRKRESSSPWAAMVDQMKYGFGETGFAMRALLDAYVAALARTGSADQAYADPEVQRAMGELIAQQSNTTQVLRRLEFGTAMSGAPKGAHVLIAMR